MQRQLITGYHRAPIGVAFPGNAHGSSFPVADDKECYLACLAEKANGCKGWGYSLGTGKCNLKTDLVFDPSLGLMNGVSSGKLIHRNRGG